MKKSKILVIILLFLIILLALFLFFNKKILNKTEINKKAALQSIVLDGSYDLTKKQIYLSWNVDNSENYLYKCYQKREDSTQYQSISTTLFEEGEYIKVLNVYPSTGNNLATWMDSYGMGIIKVDEVTLNAFNTNPTSYLKDSDENWKYDVLVFGFWDCNNSQDLNETSAKVVEEFINAGKGCIFGHDTISLVSGDALYHPYFATLAKYVNISNRGYWTNNSTTSIYINEEGVFTSYPWEIGNAGTYLTIPTSHTLDQTANGDIWLKFDNDILSGNQNFYLTTWNNCAMIQTGHSNGTATDDEQKILANLIFYTNQLTSETSMYDYTVEDTKGPKQITGLHQSTVDYNTIKIEYNEAEDCGNIYNYYIEGLPKLDNLDEIQSNSIEVETKSGIKGYSYIIDYNPECTNLDNVIETTDTSIEINIDNINWGKTVYLHIAAIDNSGNVGEISTIEISREDPIIFYYYVDDQNILLRVISSRPLKQFKYPEPNGTENIIVNLNSNKDFAVDYNVQTSKDINVELILEDGTVINKTLSINIK